MDTLTKALEVAALGFPVFPVRLCPTACLKCNVCKAPACPHGFHDASSDPEQIKRLWRDYPGELIGVATGAASGFDVLDIDSTKHPEATAWWMSHRRYIQPTRTHQTGSGGLHLLFKHHELCRPGNGRLGVGLDIKGVGGYIVWWPAYGRRVLNDSPITEWPSWLLSRQQPIERRFRRRAPGSTDSNLDGLSKFVSALSEGNRNSGAFWAFCRAYDAVAEGLVGEHTAVDQIAAAVATTGLSENEIRAVARSARRASRGRR